ncbi:MAG: alpha/beta hydrolase [Candidatus Limnocylindrales bacterium]
MRTLNNDVTSRHLGAWVADRWARPHPGLAGIAVAIAVFDLIVVGGGLDQLQATLGAMGFDPDRARLLVALMTAGATASGAGFASRRWTWGVLASVATVVACFGPTFVGETRIAIASPAHDFDPLGWALAAFSLLTAATVVGWVTATLGIHVRSGLAELTTAITAVRADRSRRSVAGRAAVRAIAVIVSLAIAAPAIGDMVNFSPDIAMRHGTPTVPGLGTAPGRGGVGGLAGVGALMGDALAGIAVPGVAVVPGAVVPGNALPGVGGVPVALPTLDPSMVAGPVPGSGVTAGAVSLGAPWTTHAPKGSGRVVTVGFPAPWIGGIFPMALVDVYLPPGYDASTTRRYPVVYSAPWALAPWDKGTGFRGLLDRLVTSGALPPALFVFASQFGALYPSSECTNSYDGRQWFERYIVGTVVPYVDAHYRTVPRPAGRSLLGFSEGAYCAASLLVRHPDVFGQAAALSGYYQAGLRSAATPSAWRVFGGDAARLAAASPTLVVGTLSSAARRSLFIVLEAQPNDPLFGAEYARFATALSGAGIAHATIPILGVGHSWAAVRTTLESVLRLLAERQVRMGVAF